MDLDDDINEIELYKLRSSQLIKLKEERSFKLNEFEHKKLCEFNEMESLKRLEGQLKNYEILINEKESKKRDVSIPCNMDTYSNIDYDRSDTSRSLIASSKKPISIEDDIYYEIFLEELQIIKEKLMELPVLQKSNFATNSSFNSISRSALIVFYKSGSNGYNFIMQFFRIDKKTTFTKLKFSVFNLFQIDFDENFSEIRFFLINNEFNLIHISNEDEEIHCYIMKKNCQNIRFLVSRKEEQKLITPNYLKETILGEKTVVDINLKNLKMSIITPPIKSFFMQFIGVTKHMIKKIVLEYNKDIVEKIYEKTKPSKSFKFFISFKWLGFITIYFIFLIISLNSLFTIMETQKDYFTNLEISKFFSSKALKIYNLDSIYLDLYLQLKPFFYKIQNHKIPFQSIDRLKGIILSSQIRVSMYNTQILNCPKFILNKTQFCYYPYFNSSTSNKSNSISYKYMFSVTNDTYINDSLNKMLIIDNNNVENNKVNISTFDNYQKYLFNNLTIENRSLLEYYSYASGTLGDYYSDGSTFFFDPNKLNDITLKNLLYVVTQSNLWNWSLRSIVVSFTLYNIHTQKSIYITIMYEIDNAGYIVTNSTTSNIFISNFYFGSRGLFLWNCDIVRIVCVGLILVFTFIDFISFERKLKKMTRFGYFNLFLSPKFTLNLIIIVFNVLSFCTRLLILNIDFRDVIISLKTKYFEFYSVNQSYSNQLIYENVQIFATIFRVVFFLYYWEKVRTFIHYIIDIIHKIFYLFLIMFFQFYCLSVMANNILGPFHKSYSNLPHSINSGLMTTIGFFYGTIDNTSSKSDIVVLCFIYFIVIYFFLNVVVGTFIDVYRISSLKRGYPYYLKKKSFFNYIK